MEYSYRASKFTKEKIYRITNYGLEIIEEEEETSRTIPFSDFSKIKLSFVDPKNYKDFYMCQLFKKDGTKIELKSTHFVGIADFEDRGATYTPFVIKLHEAMPETVKFVKGVSWGLFLFTIWAFVMAILLFMILGLYNLFWGTLWLGIIFSLASILFIFRLIKNVKKNMPGSYTTENIPTNLLPS